MTDPLPTAPSAAELRERFAGPATLSIGLEEEVMLLDPETLDLAPVAAELLPWLDGDGRFKLEVPAAQLELVTPPQHSVGEAVRALGDARRALIATVGGRVRVAGAGVHPFSAGRGQLNGGDRNAAFAREYGEIARRQLVFGLHVHVAVGGPDRSLAVFNALRGHLPELAALAGNAPFYEGHDTGLDSVRPMLSGLLPRQGVPPALGRWEDLAGAYAWGAAGTFPARQWWWEARLHPSLGTVEVRVPDSQSTLDEVGGVAAVVHALVARLAARHDAGEELSAAPAWKIEENRWSACRHGSRGTMADLATGRREPTRRRLERLLEEIELDAGRLGCASELIAAAGLIEAGGAARQRAMAADGGVRAMTAWMADSYVPVAV